MDKYIETFIKYLDIENVEDNLYRMGEEYFFIGTREELEEIYAREKLTREDWVESVKEGYTDSGYEQWVNDLKEDIQELNSYNDESFQSFGDIIVIRAY